MRRLPLLTLLCALFMAAFSSTAANARATQSVFPFSFYADSLSALDSCPHGITKGTIKLAGGPLEIPRLSISGVLIDRPAPDDPSVACSDDGYYSVATFTSFYTTGASRQVTVRADNRTVPVAFSPGLAGTITKVTVKVCRDPLVTAPPSYCGTEKTIW